MKPDKLRPSSEAKLNALLKSAYDLARKSQYDQALEICDWLIEEKTTEVAGYRERAAIKEHMDDLDGAIGDLKEVISRFDKEPADFHALGLLLLQSGATTEAIEAFGQAISLGEELENHYYTDSSYLFRAEARLKLNDPEEALVDVERLPDGYKAYVPGSGMRSKEDIATQANAALARRLQAKAPRIK